LWFPVSGAAREPGRLLAPSVEQQERLWRERLTAGVQDSRARHGEGRRVEPTVMLAQQQVNRIAPAGGRRQAAG